ncbi:AAA family ATPase [Pseudomonas sp. 35 E 8]|uniref:AAA family ATPase n=1 Tax=Pseudomonas sp. 35 E 8 TaxID=1844103 RepID=UPI0008122A0A|nr:AAA family ATPase [Pseudomonas sp. 35 E 8]CRM19395.1 putative ATP-binding protein involved in virulence [Pseudomonas sp. 35 E 8]
MEILSLTVFGKRIDFPENKISHANKIDLLTGPNGSGKTRTLSALAEKLSGRNSYRQYGNWTADDLHIDLRGDLPPQKVIAQTYSPFSRFPSQIQDNSNARESLTSVYAEGKRRSKYYSCLGLFRSSPAIINNLSKRALETSIFNISESPECAASIAGLMPNIGLQDKFTLRYKSTRQFNDFQSAYKHGGAEVVLEHLKNTAFRRWNDPVSRELRQTDPSQFSELLVEAFRIVEHLKVDNQIYQAEFGSHSRNDSYDYAIVQALSLFRQLNMLELVSCNLTNFDGHSFDVAQASSGQQQMICSIMELASSLDDDALILIDEPELSLHPKWQQMYLDHLHAALESFSGCHVLLATHSPLVVQRGLQTGAGVIQLGAEHNISSLTTTASVEGTLLDVFDTPVYDSVYLANQIISAITRAEEGGVREKQTSRNELRRLEKIYAHSSADHHKTINLIRQALELIELEG